MKKQQFRRKCRLCGRSEEHGELIDKTVDNQKYRVCQECNSEMI